MTELRSIARILHQQWRRIIESNESELQTISNSICIGMQDDNLWASLEFGGDENWDSQNLNIPAGLATYEINQTEEKIYFTTEIDSYGLFNQFICELILAKTRNMQSSEAIIFAINQIRAKISLGRSPMSINQQRGLIGELLFLEYLIDLFGDEMVNTWAGPNDSYDSIHDFISPRLHFEIKSTSTNPPIVDINEIEQLDWRGDFQLYLVVQNISDDPNGCTLSEHVARISAKIESDYFREQFMLLCQFSGFNENSNYRNRFSEISARFFIINEDSQILQPALFTDIPRNVLDIRYSLAVNELQEIEESNIDFSEMREGR